MKKIYIWGAGECFDLVYSAINCELCIVAGVVDSSKSKWGKNVGDGFTVTSINELLSADYDYIVISVRNYEAILDKCREMEIDDEKIIIFWKSGNVSPYIDYTRVLWDLKRMLEQYKSRWENLPYEMRMKSGLKIRSAEELLNAIIFRKVSLCRFGDGEFEIMRRKERLWYQEVNEALALRLEEVLNSNHENIIIAIADDFDSLENYTEEAADAIRSYLSNGTRREVMELFDPERIYFDAYVSRPYMMYKDKNHAANIFNLFKTVWNNRNLLIVEGEYSRMGVRNDLFSGAKSIRRILCPPKNAYDQYGEILDAVKGGVYGDELVLVSLGPTATILAYDLARCGIQTLDIGQIDNEYEWYLRKADERIEIPGKGVAEVRGGREPKGKFEDCDYEKQIITRIKQVDRE